MEHVSSYCTALPAASHPAASHLAASYTAVPAASHLAVSHTAASHLAASYTALSAASHFAASYTALPAQRTLHYAVSTSHGDLWLHSRNSSRRQTVPHHHDAAAERARSAAARMPGRWQIATGSGRAHPGCRNILLCRLMHAQRVMCLTTGCYQWRRMQFLVASGTESTPVTIGVTCFESVARPGAFHSQHTVRVTRFD